MTIENGQYHRYKLILARIPLLQYLLCYDYQKWTKLWKEWLEKTSSYNETPYLGMWKIF